MNNTAVFAIGRFNPPHIGHELLIHKVADTALNHEGSGYIFTTHTHDSQKNPLKWHEKTYFLEKMFPYTNIVKEENVKGLFDAIAYLGNMGYNHVMLVAGGDRIGKFRQQIKLDQVKKYGIDKFSVVNAGYRDDNSVGVQRASSTKQREYVRNNDFESFAKHLPNLDDSYKRKMFSLIKGRLNDE